LAGLTGGAKQRYVAEMFARISGRYDLMNTLMTGGLHHRWKPQTVGDIIEFVVGRILAALGIDEALPDDLQYQESS
jgi:ubiquinone/menaquinone biosynthesis C-methylase UbiE